MLTRLEKHKFIPFINTTPKAETATWARIGKSTIFELDYNAETEDNDFIEDKMPTTDIKYYKPSMAQELQTNAGDPAFDYIYNMAKHPNDYVGENAKQEVLLVFAGEESLFDAWDTTATLTLNNLNTVDQKISFDLAFNTITEGTATVTGEGAAAVPAFTAAG